MSVRLKYFFAIVLMAVAVKCRADDLPVDSTVATLQHKTARSELSRTVQGLNDTDSDYIEPQHYDFAAMIQATRNFENFSIASNGQSMALAPDPIIKVGPYFGWRWLFLGWTFDLKNIGFTGNGPKREFSLSLYSSKVGIDLYYRRTGSDYKLREVKLGYGLDGDLFEGMPFDGVSVGITGLNAYYIFNHRHFSYPAAFSQSTRQKISCGSWMAGAGYTANSLDLDFEKLERAVRSRLGRQVMQIDSGLMFDRIKFSDYSLSVGYAYNWVFARYWLFCASAQLALAYKTSKGNTPDEDDRFSFHKVNLDGIARFGLVYNNDKWYAGTSLILCSENYHNNRFSASNMFGSLNVYAGFNFKLKKRYRKNKT